MLSFLSRGCKRYLASRRKRLSCCFQLLMWISNMSCDSESIWWCANSATEPQCVVSDGCIAPAWPGNDFSAAIPTWTSWTLGMCPDSLWLCALPRFVFRRPFLMPSPPDMNLRMTGLLTYHHPQCLYLTVYLAVDYSPTFALEGYHWDPLHSHVLAEVCLHPDCTLPALWMVASHLPSDYRPCLSCSG